LPKKLLLDDAVASPVPTALSQSHCTESISK